MKKQKNITWSMGNKNAWKAVGALFFKVIVAGFRGKVALKNRTLGVPGVVIDKACIEIWGVFVVILLFQSPLTVY